MPRLAFTARLVTGALTARLVTGAFTGLLVAGIATTAQAQPTNPAQAQQPDPAQARAKELRDGIKTFRLGLYYNGPEDKPFYRLTLSVPPIGQDRSNPFHPVAQVSEEEAGRIIDYLAQSGLLADAVALEDAAKQPLRLRPTVPGYALEVGKFYEDLGWGLPMLKRLDGLRKVLDGDAAKNMDLLLGRLSGLRAQWEKEPIAQLIRQLGDNDFAVRQAATKKLTEMGEATHPVLKDTLEAGGVDVEIRRRIEMILAAKPTPPAQGGPSVTDAKTGITVAITGDGNELTATKGGKVYWKTQWAGPPATALRIKGGVVIVSPGNSAYDPATGRLLWKKQ